MQDNKEQILKKYFGYDKFRSGQEEVVENLLSAKDVLCIMPTGAGKSICYQLPALMLSGITIVVSPLISLMKDQVQFLVKCGVKAAYINSSLSPQVVDKVLTRVAGLCYKIIYVAPERLNTIGFINAIKSLDISMVVVDEAHCISRWGHDFRPSYLEILTFIDNLPRRPIIGAFTATATETVKEDICKILRLRSPFIKITSFDRPNLFFDVRKPKNKDSELLSIIKGKNNESGIVYCATRKKVEEVCNFLNENNIKATRYHAGLNDEEKTKNQDDFIFDNIRIMVATNAFGMGVDKSNVSFVVHYNMPKDMESYYQEAGRAGRDGNKAQCILLFSESDIFTNKYLISQSEKDGFITDNEYKLLNKMVDYCKTDNCLRKFILQYFGEKYATNCGNCGVCCNNNYENIDATDKAKIILSCIGHLPRQFGKSTIITVLQGGKSDKISSYNLNGISEFGAMKSFTRSDIGAMIDKMLDDGLLEQEGYDYPVLKVCGNIDEDHLKFYLRVRVKNLSGKHKKKKESANVSDTLFTRLKKLRQKIAKREDVPAYIIFSDATLADMWLKKPKTKEEFLNITGVGQIKCDRYSEEFISEIKKYLEQKKG